MRTNIEKRWLHTISSGELYGRTLVVPNGVNEILSQIPIRFKDKKLLKALMLAPVQELKLESRIFHSYDEIRRDHRWKEGIDYSKVDEIIHKKIEVSVNFLKNALQF